MSFFINPLLAHVSFLRDFQSLCCDLLALAKRLLVSENLLEIHALVQY